MNKAIGSSVLILLLLAAAVFGQERTIPERHAADEKYEYSIDEPINESGQQVERLAALGRVWGAAKFFHPYLAYKDIDWDGAVIKAIPEVKSAQTPEQYRQAISNMLQVLNDPATTVDSVKVEAERNTSSSTSTKPNPAYYQSSNGVVTIKAIDWAAAYATSNPDGYKKQPETLQEIGKAQLIALDCRFGDVSPMEVPTFYLQLYLDNVLPLLLQGSVPLGTKRYRVHNGYPPQRGNTSGGYSSSLVTDAPSTINGRAQTRKPMVVIVDGRSAELVELLAGLQSYGAKIILEGKSSSLSGARQLSLSVPDGLRVKISTTEFVHPSGGLGFKPDLISDKPVDNAVIVSLSKSSSGLAATLATGEGRVMSSKDKPYPEMGFPSEEYRLLGLFRFWNVIEYFFPYKHLIDKPWKTVLTDFIPRFQENKTQLDYEMTVAEMTARIQDSHGFVSGFKMLNQSLGTHAPPLRVRGIGNKLVVSGVLDEKSANGIKVGDVVRAVDGQDIEQRIAYLSKFRALSTEQAGRLFIYPAALRGAPESMVKLRIESADGQVRDVELKRNTPLEAVQFPQERTTAIYEVLPSGVGYIDLARLPLADAHKALDTLMNTPAIIFDMRGYPNGTAWELAPRLTEKKDVTAALFRRPFLSAANLASEDFADTVPDFSFGQKLPPAKGAVYKGRVVMLIDQDAMSQSEHTCMFFESATSVTFIGSPTSGANGDVTNLVLPGGIYASFSGHDVRHADGRQLQRLGIQPTIKVEPTIAGVREKRDEVLDAGIKFLNSTVQK